VRWILPTNIRQDRSPGQPIKKHVPFVTKEENKYITKYETEKEIIKYCLNILLFVFVGVWAGKPTRSIRQAQNQFINARNTSCSSHRINSQTIIVVHDHLGHDL
jgi:hypothetical protein